MQKLNEIVYKYFRNKYLSKKYKYIYAIAFNREYFQTHCHHYALVSAVAKNPYTNFNSNGMP